ARVPCAGMDLGCRHGVGVAPHARTPAPGPPLPDRGPARVHRGATLCGLRCHPVRERMMTDTPARDRFTPADAFADVAVIVVTYNSAEDIDGLIDSLVAQTTDLRLRVIVADNDSADGTADVVAAH